MKILFTIIFSFISFLGMSQNYTSYFTGNASDNVNMPNGGICLMGGATENDEAMKWFLTQANGGDILVLRASGSDGYNNYFYSELGIPVNSVESIVFNDATAADEVYIHQKIQQAEAIWFAGGDQWNYVSYWRGNTIANLINDAIHNRNIAIGGTSAGMAILGQIYFSAENGTITSPDAVNNPYHPNVTVDSTDFIETPFLQHTITDTHYDNPDRYGRHIVFLARILTDWGIEAKGIACEEYTAVCVAPDGIARVFGEYPDYEDYAYFLQVNCEVDNNIPETCIPNTALTWNHGGQAIKTYKVPGTLDGANTFDLNDWKTGSGGIWQRWYVLDGGIILSDDADIPDCTLSTAIDVLNDADVTISPNPSQGFLVINVDNDMIENINIKDISGKELLNKNIQSTEFQYDTNKWANGIYIIYIKTTKRSGPFQMDKKRIQIINECQHLIEQ